MPSFVAHANDGYIYSSAPTWARAYAGENQIVYNAANVLHACAECAGGDYYVYKINIPFDTSALTDDPIDTVSLYLRCIGVGAAGSAYTLVTSPKTAGAALTTADAGPASWGSTSAGGAASATLDTDVNLSVDKAVISIVTNGYTHIGIRQNRDIANTAPGAGETYWAGFASQDHATAAYRPMLTVTYTVGGPKFWMLEGRT